MKLIIIFSIMFSLNLFAECVPAITEVKLPSDINTGMYHRVHPSGNYILVSASGGYGSSVSLVDISATDDEGKSKAKAYITPMKDEAYPVEGSWKLFASPYHSDGMRYYDFKGVLANEKNATPVFNDSSHNQFYHSSAELPGSNESVLKFRTLLWLGSSCADYEVSYNADGSVKSTTKGKSYELCKNLGKTLNNPILSKDGTEVASQNSAGNTVIYKIKSNNDCDLDVDLGYATSKVSFSYPEGNSKGKITFVGSSTQMINGVPQIVKGVHQYDRDTKETKFLSKDITNASYPGMTKDGRVVFINKSKHMAITVDPNQLNPDGSIKEDKSKCIQVVKSTGSTLPVPVKTESTSQ
jgi:hypothetical protein